MELVLATSLASVRIHDSEVSHGSDILPYFREFDLLLSEHPGQQVLDGREGEGVVWLQEQLHKELCLLPLRPSATTFTTFTSDQTLIFIL